MFCPNCKDQLFSRSIKTDSGAVELSYCGSCGGIWSGSGEINFLKLKDLDPLAHLLNRVSKIQSQQELVCPQDRNRLELFQGESVPREVTIFRCSVCQGAFFPGGMLKKFKEAQEAKIHFLKTWKIPLGSVSSVLLPVLLIMVLAGSLVITLVGLQRTAELRTPAKEVVSQPAVTVSPGGQVSVSFTTIKPAATKLRYWSDPALVTEVWVSVDAVKIHQLRLTGLETGRVYSYQIVVVEPERFESEVDVFEL